MQSNYQNSINSALKELNETKSVSSALSVCKTLLSYMGAETSEVEDIELTKLRLPNAERYDRWFEGHPHFRGDRACFDLTPTETNLEAKFYSLQKRSKLFIAGSVSFTPNFEDREYTRADPSMKVGIDFFLPPEKNSVIVVLSNKGSLRLVELSGRLTNTQHEIFALWHDIAHTSDRNVLHATLWESFKLSSLNEKFYEGIANSFTSLTQHLQANKVEEQLANQFANRLHGRLLFLWFLRKKHIINEEADYFNIEGRDDTEYYGKTLSMLFFDVLNNEDHRGTDSVTPYLNGGLFDQDADGQYWKTYNPTFPTGFFKTLYDHFDSFNFTTDESTPEYEQIAIDPEMLGRIFESFLATLKTETGAQAKKANGAFYTPREIVSYMSRESIRQYLYTSLDASATLKKSIDELLDRPDNEWALAGTNSKRDTVAKEDRERILSALRDIRVLDPAVGSGAFPMGVLHKMLSLYERLDPSFDSYETKLSILRNNIYGVDIDPTAIEIARLRAWLSVIVDAEDAKKIKPLPNLDFKFLCANTLVGLVSSETSFTTDETLKPTLMRIRDEYYATSSKVKKVKLQKEYLKLTHKESLFDSEETKQLKNYQPFDSSSSTSFYDPELMHGVSIFDVIIGNPPYGANIDDMLTVYKKLYPEVTKSYVDIYKIFFDFGFKILKPSGVETFIAPNTYLAQPRYQDLRSKLLKHNIIEIINLGENVFESATVPVCISTIKNEQGAGKYVLKDCSINGKYSGSITNSSSVEISTDSVLMNGSSLLQIASQNKKDVPLGTVLEVKDGGIKYQRSGIGLKSKGGNDLYERLFSSSSDSFSNSIQTWYGKKIDRYFIEDTTDEYFNLDYKNQLNKNEIVFYSKEAFKIKEKILWRQTASHLIATIDTEGRWFRNTIQCGWIRDEYKEKVNPYYILGLFNSLYFKFLYKKIVNESAGRAFPQVKMTYLKQLPIRIANEAQQTSVANLVMEILEKKKRDKNDNTLEAEESIDNYIFDIYELSKEESAEIRKLNKIT